MSKEKVTPTIEASATQYLVLNGKVSVIKLPAQALQSEIPAAVYTLGHSELGGYSLDHLYDKYPSPAKMYGSIKTRRNKIVDTFLDRDCSTGVTITGLKGAGKSELAKQTCNKAIKEGYPVIVISEPYVGTEFNRFIQDLGPCVIFYDEFGKIFKRDLKGKDGNSERNQEQLLTLFDGSITGRRLILITENHAGYLNEFLVNRPGRVFYNFQYEKLEDAVVTGYIKDFGLPKKFGKEVVEYSRTSPEFTIDILKAICEQKLRYNESLEELTKDLNMASYGKLKLRLIIEQVEFTGRYKGANVVTTVINNYHPKMDFTIDFDRPYEGGGDTVTFRRDYECFDGDNLKYSDGKRVIYQRGDLAFSATVVSEDSKSDMKNQLEKLKAL